MNARIGRYSHAWRALRHRNFRLFFVGQGISVIGTWMTRLATSWLVYRMTHSAVLLGLVTFSGQIASFIFQPLAGTWVERQDRRRVLIWTQIAACVQSLALAALTLSNVINIWEIIALATIQGVINSLDTPARHSFLIQMVEGRDDLSNAIAINSSMQNGARLIGPAIAGFVIAEVGEGWCFLIDGVSYVPVVISLLMMTIHRAAITRQTATLFEGIREGWRYVRDYRAIRSTLLIFSLTSLMGYPYNVLMPLFADKSLHGGPHTLGLLTGASGVGALISALSLAFRKSPRGLSRMIQISAAMLGIALIAFGFSTRLWLSMILLAFAGFGLMQSAAASNTVIQSLVEDDKRARVMSYYAMAFFGAAPIGSLFAGFAAQAIGAPMTVALSGLCFLGGSFWFAGEIPKMIASVRSSAVNEGARHEVRP